MPYTSHSTMYLSDGYLATSTVWNWTQRLEELAATVLQVMEQSFSRLFGRLPDVLNLIFFWIYHALAQPSVWILTLFNTIVDLAHTHIYWAHIMAWSIFFGPIVVLGPFFLLHEILILLAYYLTYTFHGLLPNSLADRYELLRLSLEDTRESLYSLVDRSSSVFNRWTAEHTPLMVLRLAGGVLGSILLCGIWVDW